MTTDYREMHTHIRLRDGFFNPDMLYETDMIDEVFLELFGRGLQRSVKYQ